MNRSVFISSCIIAMSAFLQAADVPVSAHVLSTSSPFNLATDTFDGEVENFYTGLVQNIIRAAKALEINSPLAKLYEEMAQKSLNTLLKDESILNLTQDYYTIMLNDKAVQEAFSAATNIPIMKERVAPWTEFRKIAAKCLEQQCLLKIFPRFANPTPGSIRMIEELLERNQNITFDDQQKQQYKALTLVLFSTRQIHRLTDKVTDNRNLLLPNEVTD